MADFVTVTLETLALQTRGSFAMGPFGSDIKADNFVECGVPIIKGQNLGSGRLLEDSFDFLTEEKADELSNSVARSGDIVFTHRGTLGQVVMIPRRSRYPRYVVSQSQMKVSLDEKKALPEYVTYYFQSSLGQHVLMSYASQTGVPAIGQPLTSLKKMLVNLPSIEEQIAIVGVLGALDDKIDSNLRTWRLSTELVRTEYELLVSGESGSPYRMRDICDFNLRTRKPGDLSETIRYVDISSVEAGVVTGESEITWANAPSRARRSVADGDLIFSTVRPARMAYSMMFDPDSSTVVSTGFAVMSPKGVPSVLLFAIVSDAEFGKYCESVSQGSAYPAVSPDSMGNYEVKLPEKDMLATFGVRTEPILRRAHQGLQENRALSDLRDALLPELLSGRLRVKDAESMMENV